MKRVLAYAKTLLSFQKEMGCMRTLYLLYAILAVKLGTKINLNSKFHLERWAFFQKLYQEKNVLVNKFSLNECVLCYGEKAMAGAAVNLALRIPRSRSSDSLVFEQIFLRKEYQHVIDWFAMQAPNLAIHRILDVGANIGCAALFFYSRFPKADIHCLEPESSNLERLATNIKLTPHARIRCHHGAIWTEACHMSCVRDFREGDEWASRFIVQEQSNASLAGIVRAVDVWQLLDMARFDSVDLFKMDVEGAEASLLNAPEFKRFLKEKVQLVAIEIHQEFISIDQAKTILSSLGFKTQIVDEYLCGCKFLH